MGNCSVAGSGCNRHSSSSLSIQHSRLGGRPKHFRKHTVWKSQQEELQILEQGEALCNRTASTFSKPVPGMVGMKHPGLLFSRELQIESSMNQVPWARSRFRVTGPAGIHQKIVVHLGVDAGRAGQAASAGTADSAQNELAAPMACLSICNFLCRAFLLWWGKSQLWFLVSSGLKCKVWMWCTWMAEMGGSPISSQQDPLSKGNKDGWMEVFRRLYVYLTHGGEIIIENGKCSRLDWDRYLGPELD